MTGWIFVLVCTGTAWCIPEHNNWRSGVLYPTKEECQVAGRAAAQKYPSTFGERWMAFCIEGVR